LLWEVAKKPCQVKKAKLKEENKTALSHVLRRRTFLKATLVSIRKREAQQEELALAGPLVGRTVRVVSEEAQKANFGKEGKVVWHSEAQNKVRLEVGDLLQTLVVNASLVEDISGLKKAQDPRTLRQLQKGTAQAWLDCLGYGSQDSEDFHKTFCKDLAGRKSCRAHALHLKLMCLHLRWCLQVPVEVRFLDPLLLHAWSQCREAEEKYPEAQVSVQKQERVILHLLQVSKLLLVPLWTEDSGGHWTLLAVDKVGPKPEVRYYDTLLEESVLCRSLAQHFFEYFCGEYFEDLCLPARRNVGGQDHLACGFTTGWYMEEEVRRFKGEGWAVRGRDFMGVPCS